MVNEDIPKPLDAISCYFCKYYFLTEKNENSLSKCFKHYFVMCMAKNGFTALFNRCSDFEDSRIQK